MTGGSRVISVSCLHFQSVSDLHYKAVDIAEPSVGLRISVIYLCAAIFFLDSPNYFLKSSFLDDKHLKFLPISHWERTLHLLLFFPCFGLYSHSENPNQIKNVCVLCCVPECKACLATETNRNKGGNKAEFDLTRLENVNLASQVLICCNLPKNVLCWNYSTRYF